MLAACASTEPALARDGACETCHPNEVAAWSGSRHARALVDETFQAELAAEPQRAGWCLGCHAAAGIGACASCHPTPHPAEDRGPKTEDHCPRCHQFAFPGTNNPMQDTIAESNGAACNDCHDPHAIPGSHDAGMRDSALAISACEATGEVRVSLTNVGAPHHVPTGGVDRHIDIRIWRSSAPERVVSAQLGRTFEPLRTGGKRTTSDTTIPAGQTRVITAARASLGGVDGEPINVTVAYPFVAAELYRNRAPSFPPCP